MRRAHSASGLEAMFLESDSQRSGSPRCGGGVHILSSSRRIDELSFGEHFGVVERA